MKITNTGLAASLTLASGQFLALPTNQTIQVADRLFDNPSDKAKLLGLSVTITTDAGGAWTWPSPIPANPANFPVMGSVDQVTGRLRNSAGGTSQPVNGAPQSLGHTTILFGDSISQQQTDNIPYFTGSTELGFVPLAIAFAGGGWDIIRNSGIASNTTAQMLARVDADVIAYAPAACDFMGGTNDANIDPAVVVPNWMAIFAKLCNAGIWVRHYAILPRPALTAAQKANIVRCNIWAANYWRENGGGEFIDSFSAIVDPTSTTQAVLSGTLRTDDGAQTHPSGYGAQLIAAKAYPSYQRTAPCIMLPSSAMDDYAVNSASLNHVKNPLLIGSGGASSGGAWTGTIPANWTVTGPAGGAASLVARSDGIGNNLQVAFTAGASGETYDIAQSSGVLGGGLAVGKQFFVVGSMKVISGGDKLRNFYAYMNTDGAFPSAADFCYPITPSTLPASTPEMIFKTPICTVRPDVTFAGFKFRAITAAAGAVVLQVGRVAIYEYLP